MAGKPIAAVLQAISDGYGPLGELPIPPEGISEDALRAFIGEPLTKFRFVVRPKEPAPEKPCAQTEREAINRMLGRSMKREGFTEDSDRRLAVSERSAQEERHREMLVMLDRIATALEQSNKDYADMVNHRV